jgi:ATP-binding cassette, subfamily F, member 3
VRTQEVPVIRVSDLKLELGGRPILDGLSFTIPAARIVGVIGPNGSGKSTLLRTLVGELPPDRGSTSLDGAAPGYLRQAPSDEPHTPLATAFPHLFAAEALQPQLATLGEQLASATSEAEADSASTRYDALLDQLGHLAPLELVEEARAQLGLGVVAPTESLAQLSGGEIAKLALLDLVASSPELLLLDEPTNHLDLRGIEWLDHWLDTFEGPVLLVSHDRTLLDDHVDQLLVLSTEDGASALFTGTYSGWVEEDERRRRTQWEQYRRQRREERRMSEAISAAESRSRRIEQRTIHFHYRKRAAKVARRVVTMKARIQREHARGERIERPDHQLASLRADFAPSERSASRLLAAEGLGLAVGGRSLLHDASLELRRGERVVLIGENGSGKTTLLRALLGEHPITEGTIDLPASASVGWLPQDDQSLLPDDPTVSAVDYLRAATPVSEHEAFEQLHRFLFGHDTALTAVAKLSPGELRRLALARLTLGGANLLLLDEPTNHLDLPAREAFEQALTNFDGAVLLVTHDRYFIDRFASSVLQIEDRRLHHLARTDENM